MYDKKSLRNLISEKIWLKRTHIWNGLYEKNKQKKDTYRLPLYLFKINKIKINVSWSNYINFVSFSENKLVLKKIVWDQSMMNKQNFSIR